MKNDLTCAVARDLLPSYVEGLTSAETAEAVERHVQSCPDCAACLEAMRSQPAPAEAEEVREVEYLKKVRRSGKKRVFGAALATAAALLAVFLLKIFVIGTPLQAQSVAVMNQRVEKGALSLTLTAVGSGNAFHGWRVETVEGVASIYARDVLVSPLYPDGTGSVLVPLEGVREVWLGGVSGKLIYQDGVPISAGAHALYQAKTPYVGDASALGGVARAVGLDSQRYTTELQTSERPYRWTIKFQEHWGDTSADMWMRHYYGPWMLALVDNLDEVGWTYTTATSGGKTFCQGVLTLEEADEHLAELLERSELDQRWKSLESVKDFTATPAGTQVLYELLWGDLLWEDQRIVLGPNSWIETVLPGSSPDETEFSEHE